MAARRDVVPRLRRPRVAARAHRWRLLGVTFTAFPGHTGRAWTLARWRSLARIRGGTFSAFPGHAGRAWTLARWRSLARIRGGTFSAFPGHAGRAWTLARIRGG